MVFALLGAALALAGGAQAVPPNSNCTVPGDYFTIQDAVNDPNCVTISVAPAVYNENVVIPRAVTLTGSNGGAVVSGVAPAGNVATFTIAAANVTIDGFTIRNSVTSGAAMGITVSGAGNNAVINNNIIDGITTPDTGGNGTAQAIYLTSGGPDNVSILDNVLTNVSSNRSAKGVLIGDNGGTNPSVNVVIDGNSISNIASAARGAYGVSVANVTGVSGLQITDNSISALSSGAWIHAIGLEGDTPGVVVSGNSISGLTNSSADNMGVWFESNPSFGTAQVNQNNFNLTTASFGIAVHPALTGGTVNGECNWWNSPSGPTSASNPAGTGTKVGPNVDFTPWLIAPAPSGNCIGGNVATNKDQCKKDGWMTRVRSDGSTFKNQGDCIQYANTGK
jgi:hypothetical protein